MLLIILKKVKKDLKRLKDLNLFDKLFKYHLLTIVELQLNAFSMTTYIFLLIGLRYNFSMQNSKVLAQIVH